MKLKPILLFLFLIFLIPLVIANPIYRQSSEINLKVPCTNNGTYCSGSAVCNATLINPIGVILKNGVQMDKDIAIYNLSLAVNDTNSIGEWEFTICCVDGVDNNCRTLNFETTPNGQETTVGKSIFYMGGVFLLIFLMGLTIIGWTHSKQIHNKFIFFYLFWVLLVAMSYIAYVGSTNYLSTISFAGAFFKWAFYLSVIGILPILFGSFIFVIWRAITVPEIQRMLDHGVPEDEALARSFNQSGFKRRFGSRGTFSK